MAAKIEYKQKEIHVFLDGEIDHHSACLIRASIDDAIIHKKPSLLVLDFKHVSFMDSSGIGMMIGRYKTMMRRGGTVAVRAGNRQVDRMMELSGLYRIIEKLV